MIIYAPPCPDCGARIRLEFNTDRHGHSLPDKLVEGCEHERKRRGVCRYCDQRTTNSHPRTLYCKRHRLEAKRRSAREHARRAARANPEKFAERARERYWKDPEKARARKRRKRITV